jgi:hypothetical protein
VSPKLKKLKATLEGLGHTNVRVWWEPIGPAFEMCGNSGGYFFESDQDGPDPIGLSFTEATAMLGREYFDRRTTPTVNGDA